MSPWETSTRSWLTSALLYKVFIIHSAFCLQPYILQSKHCFQSNLGQLLVFPHLLTEILSYICNTVQFIGHSQHFLLTTFFYYFFSLHTLKFTFMMYSSVGFEKCIDLCIHHPNTIQNSSMTLKFPYASPL